MRAATQSEEQQTSVIRARVAEQRNRVAELEVRTPFSSACRWASPPRQLRVVAALDAIEERHDALLKAAASLQRLVKGKEYEANMMGGDDSSLACVSYPALRRGGADLMSHAFGELEEIVFFGGGDAPHAIVKGSVRDPLAPCAAVARRWLESSGESEGSDEDLDLLGPARPTALAHRRLRQPTATVAPFPVDA